MQEEQGLSVQAIDKAVTDGEGRADRPVLPHRPARSGHRPARRRAPARDAVETASTSTRGCATLVAAGELGAKTGKGFYDNGEPRYRARRRPPELAQRFTLKAFVEACLVLLRRAWPACARSTWGCMAPAGLIPPPFARADATGLDEVLAAAGARREPSGASASPRP